ncbi:MAG: mechanosensitive ion channel family protein [Alphaproteobacteria bacterium]|nr:mechanosensitive ion channel family protein [Alphaproteobacteria bacterium]MBV8406440.1 mechanosensitive ion channel family protein [Alphaproteobacteria bacterium]
MERVMMAELARDPFVQTGVLAVVGAIVTRILLRRYPAQRLVFQLAFFAALTALLYHHDIVPYMIAPDTVPAYERFFLALAKIIWWINAAWVLTGCARVFLIFELRPREGKLIQDLVVGLIYLSAALSVFAYVFNAPIGTLIATSGVLAIILGLALQSTLADVFSGIALNLSRSYEVGDWIVLSDGTAGRVVETNWRATHLLNGSNDLVVLPNSALAKAQLTNLSSPTRSHGVSLRVRIVPTMTPRSISDVMRNVLMSSNSILASPAPTVEIRSLDAQAVELELGFRVGDFEASASARHEVYDLIYRHVRAAGLALAPPKESSTAVAPAEKPAQPTLPRTTAKRLVDAVPLFVSLTDAEKDALAETMVRKTYRKDEVLAEQGAKLASLVILRTGVLVVTCHSEEGELELSRLAPGDFFGEASFFAGHGEPGTIKALTFSVVYEVGQEALAKIMRQRPSLAEEISLTLSRRAKIGQGAADDDGNPAAALSMTELLVRIRNLFAVPHG